MAVELEALRADIKRWAERFAPYVDDDNEWYYAGEDIDGKDAQELGRLFAELRHLGHGPSPLTEEEIEALAENVSESRARSGRLDDVYDRPNSLRNLRADMRAAIGALPERFGVRREGAGT